MKLSISLPDDDIEFVDAATRAGEYDSRSALVHAAIRLLRDRKHVDSYAAAWDEWDASGDDIWDATLTDGLK